MHNRYPRVWLAALLASSFLLLSAPGCSDDPSDDPIDASVDGSVDSAVDGSIDGSIDGSVAGYTLDNVCDKLPAEICAQRRPCCESNVDLEYDQAGCEARERATCEANVAEAQAGTMVFNPENIALCLEAQQPYVDQCEISVSALYGIISVLRPCSQIFVGELEAGTTCERDAQCAPALDVNDAAGCFAGTCAIADFIPEGEACTLGAPTAFCGQDLYCDADLLADPPVGTCKPAAAVGESCADAPLVCGLRGYCNSDTQLCTALKDGGETCAGAGECNSFVCRDDNTCAPIRAFASLAECTGQEPAEPAQSMLRAWTADTARVSLPAPR